MTLSRVTMIMLVIKRKRMRMSITLVPSSSRFLQLFGQPTTTVFGFMPPSPVVCMDIYIQMIKMRMKVKVKTQPSCFLEVQQKRFVRIEKLSSGDKQSSWEQDNMIWINLSLERQQKSFSVVSLAEKETSCPNIKNIFYKMNLFRMDQRPG